MILTSPAFAGFLIAGCRHFVLFLNRRKQTGILQTEPKPIPVEVLPL